MTIERGKNTLIEIQYWTTEDTLEQVDVRLLVPPEITIINAGKLGHTIQDELSSYPLYHHLYTSEVGILYKNRVIGDSFEVKVDKIGKYIIQVLINAKGIREYSEGLTLEVK